MAGRYQKESAWFFLACGPGRVLFTRLPLIRVVRTNSEPFRPHLTYINKSRLPKVAK
ncbi:hypothetical protein JIR001_16780 [Polycladomyces abyssicola]|uniref:Uncharacterized protein n=1 Tax=Polycladomyces abyssicola TaxID=1125966 RepID=A0A8D5UHA0_9BACL|nr:hypothetical protein JIR001_16780 [Polycladomyces abyssicola]